jgi:molybdenum-dependent DNA-binding transcriptional regulator ModE
LRFLADNIPVYNLENDRSYSDSYTSVEWMRKSEPKGNVAMEPRYLRQLAEIIDLGSLSLAAKSLNVSQPTLSRNIKSLEALIGYGVTPTHIGAALGREGRAIREALRQAELDLGRWKGGLDG